jgi:hypothetical protein
VKYEKIYQTITIPKGIYPIQTLKGYSRWQRRLKNYSIADSVVIV